MPLNGSNESQMLEEMNVLAESLRDRLRLQYTSIIADPVCPVHTLPELCYDIFRVKHAKTVTFP